MPIQQTYAYNKTLELGKHNSRPWFAGEKSQVRISLLADCDGIDNEMLYRTAKQDFDSFVEKLSQKIVKEVDTTVPELPLKDLVCDF